MRSVLAALFFVPAVAIVPPKAPAPLAWAQVTVSPQLVSDGELADRQADLLATCGVADAALVRVAKRLVERKALGLPLLDPSSLGFAQRVEGEPHVWPRAWVVSARALDHETTKKKLAEWRASFKDLGERRCGVASGLAPDGTEIVAALAVDALAEMSALPMRARTGQWLEVAARLRVPAASARVIVLGPTGEPRRVPTSFEAGRVRARFAPDRPGAFTVQIVAEVATGPRPVLEARVFADTEPPDALPIAPAPGEDAGDPAADAPARLTAMVNALRDAEGLAKVTREPSLDSVAALHARKMMEARTVGHDVGDGEPPRRLQSAGIFVRESGENVAHAATVPLAHRALWESPSHRANLLRADFVRAGIGVAEDADGSVWVCEELVR